MIDEKKLIDELKESGMIVDNEYGNAMVDFIESQPKIGEWIPSTMMQTGFCDKNGDLIEVGDTVKLILDDGEERIFDVRFKTVQRVVKCHPDFIEDFSKVAITGIVFCWEGYDLFPCIDENGVLDTAKMEIIKKGGGVDPMQ